MTETTPNTVRRILCGADGSEPACRAAEVASCLARDLGAELTFVSVAKAVATTPELEEYLKIEGIEGTTFPNLSADAETCLDQAVGIARQCSAPAFRRVVEIGDPFERLSAYVEKEKIDLVILGHHARSSVGRLARKPLSQRIADDVPVKLLLVP